jgi:hypothetical protein
VFISLFLPSVSNAVEIDLDIGATYLIPAPIGNWYQKDMPYTLRTVSLTGSASVWTDKSTWDPLVCSALVPFATSCELVNNWQFGVGVGNAGRATSDAMIHDVDDCSSNCGKVSHMQGQGTEPYFFFMARKSFGSWFAEGGLYVYRPNYENTNFDWYNWQTGAGPVVSHIDHQVRNTVGIGVSLGYRVNEDWAVVAKLVPTKSTNANTTEGIAGNYYRPIYSSAFGYAPEIVIQRSFDLK